MALYRTCRMSRKHPGSRHYAAMNRAKWKAARREAFERDAFRCVRCGNAGRLEAHHRIPLEEGGDPYALENLETLCRACHIRAHRRPLTPEQEAWRAYLGELMA